MADTYSEEEKNALAGIFSLYDKDQSGFIEVEELEGIMKKIGRDQAQAKMLVGKVEEVYAQQLRFIVDLGMGNFLNQLRTEWYDGMCGYSLRKESSIMYQGQFI